MLLRLPGKKVGKTVNLTRHQLMLMDLPPMINVAKSRLQMGVLGDISKYEIGLFLWI
jgi:hypothetical protein